LYGELLQLPHVEGVYIGRKRIGGRGSRRLCVVACVNEKVAPRGLRKHQRVPAKIDWAATSRRTQEIQTDVQVIGESELMAAVLGAGDSMRRFQIPGGSPQPSNATVGIAMDHPVFGRVVTVAAHALGRNTAGVSTFPPAERPMVILQNGGGGPEIPGAVRKVVINESADYALISPPAGFSAENLFLDAEVIGSPMVATEAEVSSPAFVLSGRGIQVTRIRGVHAVLTVGPFVLRDLIVTDSCTVPGDSGACLVNAASRPMGLVEGVTTLEGKLVSVFTSISHPFTQEQATFF
jgi:hypothetical protein